MDDDFTIGEASAAERAAKVERRINELRERRAALTSGQKPSPESAELARHRAQEATHRAQDAHHAAAERHRELARVHERTANTYQRVAMDREDAPELQDEADQHWQAAHESHLRSLEDEAQAINPEKSSSG
ncbi:hypothetical protein [Mycobacterium kubicae]|nr:hypothetical protein [Mycobacterium kubicae]MCV7096097.1 hypothetical protein [Mycobacterium kubicae]ORV99419.1 hypothetical protein AWC13_10750 [Mycobacterium kubicae]QNI12251.1 hypothetical protein GAN18_14440 [Mycobacterium kubicae]QPI35767.1 hypothetical protein I2456_14240 [Mycobacterium kubicae]